MSIKQVKIFVCDVCSKELKGPDVSDLDSGFFAPMYALTGRISKTDSSKHEHICKDCYNLIHKIF